MFFHGVFGLVATVHLRLKHTEVREFLVLQQHRGQAHRLDHPVRNKSQAAIRIGFPDPVGRGAGNIQKPPLLFFQLGFRIHLAC